MLCVVECLVIFLIVEGHHKIFLKVDCGLLLHLQVVFLYWEPDGLIFGY